MAQQTKQGPWGVSMKLNPSFAGKVGVQIDGATTVVLGAQFDLVEIVSDGVNWHIIGRIGTVILLALLSGGS